MIREPAAPATRLDSIDRARGLMILLMVLGHARFFLSPTPFHPDDPERTELFLFLVRIVTHVCAPTFMLLTGISTRLRLNKVGLGAQTAFLVRRGVLLILLEITCVTFAWQFGMGFVLLQVLWATGIGMLLLVVAMRMPRPLLLAAVALPLLGHDLLDSVGGSDAGRLWILAHQPGSFRLPLVGTRVVVLYPLLPWAVLPSLGFWFGEWFLGDRRARIRRMLVWGASLAVAFLALRWTDLYGDPIHWREGGGCAGFRFFHLTKYPPSLQYLALTLGSALLLLALLEIRPRFGRVLLPLLGRHSLAVYLVHLPAIHLIGWIWFRASLGGVPDPFAYPATFPAGYAPDPLRMLIGWALVVGLLWAVLRGRESRRRESGREG